MAEFPPNSMNKLYIYYLAFDKYSLFSERPQELHVLARRVACAQPCYLASDMPRIGWEVVGGRGNNVLTISLCIVRNNFLIFAYYFVAIFTSKPIDIDAMLKIG